MADLPVFSHWFAYSAIAYNHSLQKIAAVPGSQVSVVPLQLAAQEMWDSVVAESANSLLNFRLYC